MQVFDYRGVEVIHFHRPLACQSCWFPCCLQSILVTSPLSGEVLGTVEQNWTLCKPDYSVKNHNGETVLRITGPICILPMCCDVEFKVRKVMMCGKYSCKWASLSQICAKAIVYFFSIAEGFKYDSIDQNNNIQCFSTAYCSLSCPSQFQL